jgi:hypothetical protein
MHDWVRECLRTGGLIPGAVGVWCLQNQVQAGTSVGDKGTNATVMDRVR